MKCPGCGSLDSRVLDSRPTADGSVKRRRECNGCGRRFNTYEVVENAPVTVIKKDGSREFFDRHKLRTGIERACYKRQNVNVGEIVASIENELNNLLVLEVSTTEIGEMVLRRLKDIDAVSYVRFASVYREFKDVESFFLELQEFMQKKEGI
ncbi:MAG: transcriptional repressor NrdR [Clostridia bacterium]|nr:transcriptional repressor NrdR [Clostridia bacterium]